MVAVASSPLGNEAACPTPHARSRVLRLLNSRRVSHCKPLSGVFGRCAGVNDVRERGSCEDAFLHALETANGHKQNRAPFSEERDAVFAVSRSLGAQ